MNLWKLTTNSVYEQKWKQKKIPNPPNINHTRQKTALNTQTKLKHRSKHQNCHRIKANVHDLLLLQAEIHPAVICL